MPPPFTLAVFPRLRSPPFHDRVVAAVAGDDWSVSSGLRIGV